MWKNLNYKMLCELISHQAMDINLDFSGGTRTIESLAFLFMLDVAHTYYPTTMQNKTKQNKKNRTADISVNRSMLKNTVPTQRLYGENLFT